MTGSVLRTAAPATTPAANRRARRSHGISGDQDREPPAAYLSVLKKALGLSSNCSPSSCGRGCREQIDLARKAKASIARRNDGMSIAMREA
jgi:hypothetical protein